MTSTRAEIERRIADAEEQAFKSWQAGGSRIWSSARIEAFREVLALLPEPSGEVKERQWRDLVAPMVQICEVAAKFNQTASWNAVGADALGRLLNEMAERLDIALSTFQHQGEPVAEWQRWTGDRWVACSGPTDAEAFAKNGTKVRALYAAPSPQASWRSIDSAPKDGTRFLAGWVSDSPRVVWWEPVEFSVTAAIPSGWFDGINHWEPSHWMPLPDNPGALPPSPQGQTP